MEEIAKMFSVIYRIHLEQDYLDPQVPDVGVLEDPPFKMSRLKKVANLVQKI